MWNFRKRGSGLAGAPPSRLIRPRSRGTCHAHQPPPPRHARHPRRLGLAHGQRRQRRSPSPHARVRPSLGRMPARLPAHIWRRCRPAGWADGQFRGRPPEHRRRPRGDAGPAAHRPRHCRWLDRHAARPDRPDREAQGLGRHLPPDGAALPGRRACASGPCGGAGAHPLGRRHQGRHPCADRRPRHRPQGGARLPCPLRGRHRPPARRGHRHRHRPVLRDGPRQSLGTRRHRL